MTLNVNQVHHPNGTFSGIPHLLVHNILPNESYVFWVVENGDLDELRLLLSEGHASLRDQDEDGKSLLHVGPTTTQVFPIPAKCLQYMYV